MKSKVEMEDYAMKINIRNDNRNDLNRKRPTSSDDDNFTTKMKQNRKSNRVFCYYTIKNFILIYKQFSFFE